MKMVRLSKELSLPGEELIEAKFLVVGQSGRGKSGLLKVLEERLFDLGLPFVVFDPSGVAWGIKSSLDGTRPGLPVLVIGGEHADIRLDPKGGAEAARAIVRANISCVIDFSTESKRTYRSFVTSFAEMIFSMNDTSRLLIFDEAPDLLPQTIRNDQTQTYDAVERLVRQGRNRGLGTVLVTQRLAKLNKDVATQCGSLFVFGLMGTPDRTALRGWVEAVASVSKLKEFDEGLTALKPRECWFWSPSEFEKFLRIRVDEFHTLHPDRTHLRKMGLLKSKPVTTDVSAVVSKLGAEMEKLAKEKNDVAELPKLRARVAALEAEKARAVNHTVGFTPTTSEAEIQRRVRMGIKESTEPLKKALTEKEKALTITNRRLLGIGSATTQFAAEMAKLTVLEPNEPVSKVELSTEHKALFLSRSERFGSGASPPPSSGPLSTHQFSQESHSDGSSDMEGKLVAGERRMLAALIRVLPGTLTRAQLSTLSGLSPKSGGFSNYIGRLRKDGYMVEVSQWVFKATEKAVEAVGDQPPLQTHEEIVRMWMDKFTGGERRMLEALVRNRENGMTREELAEASGLSVTSGGYSNYIGHLRSCGVLRSDNGMFYPSETLWP